jgi:GntR family transcriptional regulator
MIVDRQSPLPLYYQLKEALLERIEGGEFVPGSLIPSEKQLEEQYEISRTTVRQALNELVNSGYLYRLQGVGTFVARPKIKHNVQDLLSFTDEMQLRGLKPGSMLLSYGRILPSKVVAARLSLLEGQEVYRIVRLRLADGEPIGMHQSYLPAHKAPNLTSRKLEDYQSLYQLLLEEYGIDIAEADETLEAVSANEEESRLLEVAEGSPLLLVERVAYSNQAEPIEYVKMVYRADRYKYYAHLSRQFGFTGSHESDGRHGS